MAKYNNDALAELCSKINLYDYISNKYEVEMRSGTPFIHCPLHTDKTASLAIDVERNRFHCFSCGVGSSFLDFLRKVEGLSFNDAVDIMVKKTGISVTNLKQCDALAFYKSAKKAIVPKAQVNNNREILPKEYYDQFKDELPQEWIDEGISPAALKAYEVRVDEKSNRIVYPVYDASGNLIGVKGRTRFKDYKAIGIQKYMNYTKIGTVDYLGGYEYAKLPIKYKDEVIIFESIKSCMKALDYGFSNTVSAETSTLNDAQVRFLIKLQVKNLVIAFDHDVKMDKILSSVKMLKRFMNVWVITDRNNLTGEKDSPVDCGKEIWEVLYKERMRI